MTHQDNATKPTQEQVAADRKRTHERLEEMEAAREQVAVELKAHGDYLDGHLRLAYAFASESVGTFMFDNGWAQWVFPDENSADASSRVLDRGGHWTSVGAGTAVINSLMGGIARVRKARGEGATVPNDAFTEVTLHTYADIVSVLEITSQLPGISNAVDEPFSRIDHRNFNPGLVEATCAEIARLDRWAQQLQRDQQVHSDV